MFRTVGIGLDHRPSAGPRSVTTDEKIGSCSQVCQASPQLLCPVKVVPVWDLLAGRHGRSLPAHGQVVAAPLLQHLPWVAAHDCPGHTVGRGDEKGRQH